MMICRQLKTNDLFDEPQECALARLARCFSPICLDSIQSFTVLRDAKCAFQSPTHDDVRNRNEESEDSRADYDQRSVWGRLLVRDDCRIHDLHNFALAGLIELG